MAMKIKQNLLTATALLSFSSPVVANNLENLSSNPMAQVTSVNQLRDVSPTAWAYEALRSLVERYGCIVGYPDRTFRGERALTRWEFAAGLNACLNTLERLIQEGIAVLKEDIDKIKRLTQEFETELATLGTRVANLENRVAFLENNQFSTTTKLTGEVVMALYGVASGEKDGGDTISQNTALSYRSRLELNTSFTGKDLMYARLATGNTPDLVDATGTFQTNLGIIQPNDNDVVLEVLQYSFPITENLTAVVEAVGGAMNDFTNTLNFLDADGRSKAISLFATRNPIYYSPRQTGIGFKGNWSGLDISAGYMAGEGDNTSPGAGLFNGAYSAMAQIGYIPDGETGISFTYIHSYNQIDTGTGSQRSNFRYFTEELLGEAVPVISNTFGLQFSAKVFEKIYLGGWGGYSQAQTLSTLDGQLSRGSLDIWNWAVTFAVVDLFAEGNRAGLIVGQQPYIANSSVKFTDGTRVTDQDTSLHFEGFYEFLVGDNIRITPGLIVITSPDNNSNNSTIFLGVIRTTFIF
jgi:Carbohydrate-selective porin, OprB family/S-layer homology domain